MNIAIIGYGKMGKSIKKEAEKRKINISAIINRYEDLSYESLKEADVCIDFTHPDTVLKNIQKLSSLKKNIVVGTTGWYDHIDQVKEIVNEQQIGLIYSPNFSIGVFLFSKIVSYSAKLFDQFPDYDVAICETHHNQKKDIPSGTAKQLAHILLENIQRKKNLHLLDKNPVKEEEISLSSIRLGEVIGTHEVLFNSPVDTISLTHQANSRQGFALGAVLAAEWVKEKKGFFTLNDMIKV